MKSIVKENTTANPNPTTAITEEKFDISKLELGAIISVEGPWTKGKKFFYLLDSTFVNDGWVSAIRIMPKDSHLKDRLYKQNEVLYIPEGYLSGKDNTLKGGGYVNVFSGCTCVHTDNIREIVSVIPFDMYKNIMLSRFYLSLDNFRVSDDDEVTIMDIQLNIVTNVILSNAIQSTFKLEKPIPMQQGIRLTSGTEYAKALQALNENITKTTAKNMPKIPNELTDACGLNPDDGEKEIVGDFTPTTPPKKKEPLKNEVSFTADGYKNKIIDDKAEKTLKNLINKEAKTPKATSAPEKKEDKKPKTAPTKKKEVTPPPAMAKETKIYDNPDMQKRFNEIMEDVLPKCKGRIPAMYVAGLMEGRENAKLIGSSYVFDIDSIEKFLDATFKSIANGRYLRYDESWNNPSASTAANLKKAILSFYRYFKVWKEEVYDKK